EPSEDTSELSEEEEEQPVDKQSVLQVAMKELVRSTGQNRLDDLTVRQVAYVLALVTPWVLPSDLVEIGGQSESCLQACCDSLLHSCNPPPPEAGCLSFEYLRAIQVAKEQLLMESMTMHRRQKNKEMQSSCLEKAKAAGRIWQDRMSSLIYLRALS
ncbi:unnamed protein product, partial [Symbiodinium sp. CCMP2456]